MLMSASEVEQPQLISAASLQIGQALDGGFFAGLIRDPDGVFALIAAPKFAGDTKGAWHNDRADVPGASSCFDGYANTLAMAAAGSDLAKWALGLTIGGHADWYLPARDEQELLYRNLKPTTEPNYCSFRDGDNPSSIPPGYPYTEEFPVQTEVKAFRDGGAEAFDPVWYWASTQFSPSSAWYMHFDDGNAGYYDKGFEARARAVRRIRVSY